MADLTVSPRNKNDLTVTPRSRTSDTLTWDTITGTWIEHATDTWDSPRLGTTKRTKIDLTVNNREKN